MDWFQDPDLRFSEKSQVATNLEVEFLILLEETKPHHTQVRPEFTS